MTKPLFVAHQGESYIAPENTHAAFDLAWQLGDQAIEFDVHLTKDGQVIICHDADTFRTSGKTRKLIINECASEDLRKLDVGNWKHSKYAGEKLPLLSEVLERMPKGKIVFIEIKSTGLPTVQAVIDVMKQSERTKDEMRMISFHEQTITEYKNIWPDGPKAYYLAAFSKDKQTGVWKPSVDELIATTKRCRADGLDIQNSPPVDKAFIEKVHAANLQCYIWTEDDPAAAKRYLDDGADGITTNRAHWMAEQLAR